MTSSATPLDVTSAELARSVRETFDRVGYTSGSILETIGSEDGEPLTGRDPQVVWYRTQNCRPLDLLIRMFLLGVPIALGDAADALGSGVIAQWRDLGLLTIERESVAATVQAVPYDDLLLLYDFDRRVGGKLRADYVMGVGRSTITLATITIRRHMRRTLDLGMGCGTHAFLAERHSDVVVGVDRNPRALNFARFNAAMNSLSNVNLIEGDMFVPLAGQQFDLIVSNPPFVISPASRFLYRDGGMTGDALCGSILRTAPRFLYEGGFFQMLCNWATVDGEDWRARLAEWADGIGCDVWVMRAETRDPAVYAATWIQHTEGGDSTHKTKCFDEWMAYYERARIQAVDAGIITLRRRDGVSNWFRAEDGPEKLLGQSGDSIFRLFSLNDFLQDVRTDAALLDATLMLSRDARLVSQCEPSSDGWQPIVHELRLVRGLAYVGRIDRHVARLLERCDGQRPLRSLIAELASEVQADFQPVAAECLALVRDLVARGFLHPSTEDPERLPMEPVATPAN